MLSTIIRPEALEAFQALALGMAGAGLVATGFEALTARRASFRLLQSGDVGALASVPLVVMTAPFIILRNTIRGRQQEGRRIIFVALATIIACLWGLACGRLLLDAVLWLR